MSGAFITKATYAIGDTYLGTERIKVNLIAESTFLDVVERVTNKSLLSIPWPNIKEIKPATSHYLCDLASLRENNFAFFCYGSRFQVQN